MVKKSASKILGMSFLALLVSIVMVFGFIGTGYAQPASEWSQVGIVSSSPECSIGPSAALAIGNTVYVVTGQDDCVTEWNGTLWTSLGDPCSDSEVDCLASVNGTVYAGIFGQGVWSWSGTNWSQVGSGLSGQDIMSMTMAAGVLYATGELGYVYYLDGMQWTRLGSSSGAGSFPKDAFGIDVVNGVVYAGHSNTVYSYQLGAGDTGSWTCVGPSGGFVGSAWNMTTVDGTVYVGAYSMGNITGGVYGLDSNGNWDEVGDSNTPGGWITGLATFDGDICVGTCEGNAPSGVYCGNGSVWNRLGSLTNVTTNPVVTTDGTLYVGTKSGVYSWDGSEWSPVQVPGGLPSGCVNSILPFNGGIYAGCDDGNVYSWDGTNTVWNNIGELANKDSEATSVTALAALGSTMYASTFDSSTGADSSTGVWTWNDNTDSWSATGSNSPTQVECLLTVGGTVYAGTGNGSVWSWDGADSTSWARVGSSSPLAGSVAGLTMAKGTLYANVGGVLYSLSSATNAWSSVSGFPGIGGISTLTATDRMLYVADDNGNTYSFDGSTWTKISTCTGEDNWVDSLFTENGTVYAYCDDGNVCAWNGTQWASQDTLLNYENAGCCSLAIENGALYAGSWGKGVWELPLPVLSPGSPQAGTANVSYNQAITASGGTSPYSFAVTGGSLPAGMILSSGGALSGTPTTAGSSDFTVEATDSNGLIVSQNYTLTIDRASGSAAPIDMAAIPGLTAPVTGAIPVSTVADTGEYTAAISWSPSVTSTFAPGTAYTATITITPDSGYSLTGVAANFFTVAGAAATNAADSGSVNAVFPATATPVTGVTLGTNLTITVNGYAQLAATITPSNATNMSAAWTSSNASVATVNSSGLVLGAAAGKATITVTTADGSLTATCAVTVNADSSALTTASSTPISVNTDPVQVTVPATVTDATLTLTSTPAVSDGNATYTLPQVITTAATAQGNVDVSIQDGTTVTGSSNTFTGTINLPQVVSSSAVSVSGYTTNVIEAIELGADNTALTFSQPVRILLAGQGGKLAGWIRNGAFTPIITQLNSDSVSALGNKNDGYITVGSDLVIWTNHFTTFVAYTETPVVNNTGGGGGANYYPPTVQTSAVSTVTASSTVLNGDIASDNGYDITDYGFLWGTSASSLTNKLDTGTDNHSGAFTAALSSLTAGTTYYFEAYATNSQGTADGDAMSFTTAGTAQTTTTAPATSTFSDVPASCWGYAAINSLSGKDYITGYPDDTFKPGNQITRAEFCAIMDKVLNLTTAPAEAGTWQQTPTFTDVNTGDWFYQSVQTAVYAGIAKGYGDGTFRPNAPISRQEIACVLVQALGKSELAGSSAKTVTKFLDDRSIASWSRGYVAVALQQGIVSGYPDGSFKPESESTRAEACAMIVNFLKSYK